MLNGLWLGFFVVAAIAGLLAAGASEEARREDQQG